MQPECNWVATFLAQIGVQELLRIGDIQLIDDDNILGALSNDLDEESGVTSKPAQQKTTRLLIESPIDETEDEAMARAALTSEFRATHTIFDLIQISPFKDADLTQLSKRLERQTGQLRSGDLSQAESMLAAQAYTLDALFHNLLRRSALNMKNEFNVVERLMKLAMRAQSQCRTTLDSLAAMKKPPPELIKQTNIAHGPQQVNNRLEKRSSPNELLEKTSGQWMDGRTPQETIRGDQALEPVDTVNRPKND